MVNGISASRMGMALALMSLSNVGVLAAEAEDLLARPRPDRDDHDCAEDHREPTTRSSAVIQPTLGDIAAMSAAEAKRARKQAKRASLRSYSEA